ncbi:hypothetical protein HRbin29_02242 [bacterium HR29]|nr:hypothetical protein HRbin29_02242 [bacterium HR29]
MALRIAHVADLRSRNPFLSAVAANTAWLVPALRELGHEVELIEAQRLPAFVGRSYDVLHLHGVIPGPRPRADLTLATRYDEEAPPSRFIALTYRQHQSDGLRAIAVIPPAVDMSLIPADRDQGDHLAFSFDGRDEYALGAAIAVATRQERRLVVVLGPEAQLSESCGAAIRIGEQGGWLRVERLGPSSFPSAIWSAAAYLSFGRRGFDMAAVTALACGTPVIAFEGTPIAELVVHGESGWVCPSAQSAAQSLEHLDLLSPALARARARVVFDAEAAAFRHAQLYRQLLRRELQRPPRSDAAPGSDILRDEGTGPRQRAG